MSVNQKVFPAVFIVLISMVFTSCEKDPLPEPAVDKLSHVKVFPMYGSQDLYLDSTYQTAEGYDVQFTDIKFYGTSWKHEPNFLTTASLFDYRATGNQFLSTSVSPEMFPSIQGYLGVDPDLNHSDPTSFPNHSALNIVNAGGMHWSWNPGYIFIKVEAKVDTIADGNPLFDHNAVFHIGTDAFVQTLDFPAITWTDQGNNTYLARMKLDMQQFLVNGTETIDLKTEHTSHSGAGQEAISLKAIQNFKAALSFMN